MKSPSWTGPLGFRRNARLRCGARSSKLEASRVPTTERGKALSEA